GMSLDFETKSSYDLEVVATDNGSPQMSVRTTLSITVNDVNEHDPMIGDVASIDFTVAANASGGDEVGTAISATDADTNQTLTYALSGTGNGNFDISSTGQITVSNSASLSPGNIPLTVTVTDDVATRRQATVDITITVTAAPSANVPPTFAAATREVAESAAAESNVGAVVMATDSDGDDSAIMYAIKSGNDGDVFAIDNNGQITIAAGKSLDHETKGQYMLEVTATDEDGGATDATITINVTDVNDNAPVINSVTTANAEENQTSTGLTVTATDADETGEVITYRFVTGGADNGKFSLTGGVLAFRSAPNFESPTDAGGTANDNKYVVRVEAYDEVNTSTSQDITITVTDVNDPPEIGTIPDNLTITDGASNTDLVGSPIPATDEDRPAQTLNYNLEGADADGTFSIGTISGQIVVNNASNLDANSKSSYTLTVKVTDNGDGRLSDEESVTIMVTAAAPANRAPTFNYGGTSMITVDEDATPDDTLPITTVTATDPDDGQMLTYSLTGDNNTDFDIDSDGNIKVAAGMSLDFETKSSYCE
ncbi:MAG: cadherin repeat domain-containing protein, partial [Ekhidna sp.]|nr:cadherin repeat domain-containing protein [Ekhidna sp.]